VTSDMSQAQTVGEGGSVKKRQELRQLYSLQDKTCEAI